MFGGLIMRQNLLTKNNIELKNTTQSTFATNKKKSALDIFKSLQMPKEKEEAWRYTKIEDLNLQKFSPFQGEVKIFVTNLSEDLVEKGVILTNMNTALEKYPIAQKYFFKEIKIDKDKFTALNAAYFNNGIFLYVPKNIELEEQIRINFYSEGQSSILHNMVAVEPNSKVDFIEEYSNRERDREQLNVCITEVFANENSKINFYHLNNWTKNVYNFTNIAGAAERNAAINWSAGCFGGKLNRLKIDTNLNGQGSQCNNTGVFIGRGKEHIDFTTNAFHNISDTANNILVKGVLKDESSSAYRGLIKIEKQVQKTSSYLANHILKLGNKTVANSIPSLKIDANDVKAGHGATVGQVDEEQIFYLISRGLSKESAERLIVEGFFEAVIQRIPLEGVRDKIRGMVKQ